MNTIRMKMGTIKARIKTVKFGVFFQSMSHFQKVMPVQSTTKCQPTTIQLILTTAVTNTSTSRDLNPSTEMCLKSELTK